uniref:Extrapallial fluid protein EP28 n=1 Tax=Pinctada fucata TaxID=50426 RepID=A0A1C8K230_PINFU|nr:extrapallial fluid protein EP28 [Pinctada fucata]
MSLRSFLYLACVLVILKFSHATYQYVVGKSTPQNTYGYGSKRVAKHGIYGDCGCFHKPVGCPRLWYPQYNKACAPMDHWVNIPQKHTELEEVTNWRTATVEEVQRTPLETWNVRRTPVETWNFQKNQHGPHAVLKSKVHKKSVYNAKRKVKSLYTKTKKTYAKPVKKYRTKEVITYRKVKVEYIQCCPPLKFWFFDFPDFVDVSDANGNGAKTTNENFTK